MHRRREAHAGKIRFAAVGDILLNQALLDQAPQGSGYERDKRLISDDVRAVFEDCDLTFGNLECTLACGSSAAPTQPRVVANEALVRAVKEAGIELVNVANNHAFDSLDGGFQNVKRVLDDIGVTHFGAGMSLAEAVAPVIVEVNGIRLAFFGAVDRRIALFRFAAQGCWGVAPLNVEQLVEQVRQQRAEVDHVIVSLHWGDEALLIPSPVQVQQAHSLVDAGASMILGHHPHVLQGWEVYRGAPIVYSLGNFIADDIIFADGRIVRWKIAGRTGSILTAELTLDTVSNARLISTFDDGKAVDLDESGFGDRRTERACRIISRGITPGRYRREYLWTKVVMAAMRDLNWTKLLRIRPRHFYKAVRLLWQSRKAT